MTYKVHLYETTKYEIEVEAKCAADAMNIAIIEHTQRDEADRNDYFVGVTDRRTCIPSEP